MEKYMNLPEEKSYTAEDVVADYKVYGDKKSVAKRYNLPVSEITKINRRKSSCVFLLYD